MVNGQAFRGNVGCSVLLQQRVRKPGPPYRHQPTQRAHEEACSLPRVLLSVPALALAQIQIQVRVLVVALVQVQMPVPVRLPVPVPEPST